MILTTTDQHLKQDLCNIAKVWLLLQCGMCLNVQQLSWSQFMIPTAYDAIFSCNHTEEIISNISSHELPILIILK
jgi:hypothetical protein